MATKAGKKRAQAARGPQARKGMSRQARAAYGEIQQGVKSLEKSITEIQRGLSKAEQKIEAEARARIRALRKEARAQLGLLQSKQRDAARALKKVSTAAGQSWQDITQSADAILADARATAAVVVDRFRGVFGH
jgi:septation ring formation regulator EzrA